MDCAPIVLAHEPAFRIGQAEFRPATREALLNGYHSVLEPRVMQLLVALHRAQGGVVTKDQLVQSCWAGRVVGDDAINRVVSRLRNAAEKMGSPFRVETITKVGYRLSGPSAPAIPARPLAGWARARRIPLAALLIALVALATLFLASPERDGRAEAASGSIAVLPFRNLSSGDAYFAEGVAEEILAQLSRTPGLRVAGRTSSWQFKGESADLAEIGRRLDVGHVLEGSVRSAGNRVKVEVALVRTDDGVRLWSESFDGSLDDVLAIQHRIGSHVTRALGGRLVEVQPIRAPVKTSGAAYGAYLTARSLIRERNARAMMAAREHLERALRSDPGFAPAWSSMAQVKRWEGNKPGPVGQKSRDEALAYARRALSLAPDLAEAHGVLGMILDFDNPIGQRHIRRAAALDPHNAEYQYWLGHVYGNEAHFPRMLAAYRRAFEIDPLWAPAHLDAVLHAWRMGYRDEAVAVVRRVEREGSRYDAHTARAFLALHAGDLSGAISEFGAAGASTADLGKQGSAAVGRAFIYDQLGLVERARIEREAFQRKWAKDQKRPLAITDRTAAHLRLKRGQLPTPAELAAASKSRGDPAGDTLLAETIEHLVNAGRASEVVALYDGEHGVLGLSARSPLPRSLGRFMRDAPLLASALTAVGRRQEAFRLLRHMERMIEAGLRRSGGKAPADFYAEAAHTWAMLGRRDAAVAALERARRNGWINAYLNAGDLADDIGEEPAFRSLLGDPGFERTRARMNAHLDRERREAAQLRR